MATELQNNNHQLLDLQGTSQSCWPFTVSAVPGHDSNKDAEYENSLPVFAQRCRTSDPETSGSATFMQELDLKSIDALARHLWFAGRFGTPRSLHVQAQSGREIITTHNLSMHLVQSFMRVYLKPLPLYLVNRTFWDRHLSCDLSCSQIDLPEAVKNPGLFSRVSSVCKSHKVATGLIYSYCFILQHEIDFNLAKEKRRVPAELDWPTWRTLAQDLINRPNKVEQVDFRFWFGERPGVNDDYRLSVVKEYVALAGIAFWVILVLTALQVTLASRSYGTVKSAAFLFAGFTLAVLLGGVVGVLIGVLLANLMNFVGSVSRRKFILRELRGNGLEQSPARHLTSLGGG